METGVFNFKFKIINTRFNAIRIGICPAKFKDELSDRLGHGKLYDGFSYLCENGHIQ